MNAVEWAEQVREKATELYDLFTISGEELENVKISPLPPPMVVKAVFDGFKTLRAVPSPPPPNNNNTEKVND